MENEIRHMGSMHGLNYYLNNKCYFVHRLIFIYYYT